jgi:hypothetical protein
VSLSNYEGDFSDMDRRLSAWGAGGSRVRFWWGAFEMATPGDGKGVWCRGVDVQWGVGEQAGVAASASS